MRNRRWYFRISKKLGLILLTLIFTMGALGVSYAKWTQSLSVNAPVTIAAAPAVDAIGANAGGTTATLNGSLTHAAPGNTPVAVGFTYWPTNNPSNITTVSAGSVSSVGTFSVPVTGLSPNTSYTYKSTGSGFFTVNSGTFSFNTNAALNVATTSLSNGEGAPSA